MHKTPVSSEQIKVVATRAGAIAAGVVVAIAVFCGGRWVNNYEVDHGMRDECREGGNVWLSEDQVCIKITETVEVDGK